MEFTGRIEFISHIEMVGEKQHHKQYLIISDEKGQYPNRIKVDCFNKVDEVAAVQVGQMVTALYNTKVTEYNGRHYCSLDLWKFKAEQIAPPVNQIAPPAQEQSAQSVTPGSQDLPF